LIAGGAAAVVATDIVEAGVNALADELRSDTGHGAARGRVLPRRLDVADAAATAALVEEIEATVGPIDIWFANAGLAGGGGPEAPDETWNKQWQVNLMAHVYATRALLPGWLARGEGYLVTTASMAGILTSLGDGVYAATKHAAVGYAEWLAITYGDQGIRVSCVCPGAVDTNMLRAGTGGNADKAAQVIGGGDVLDPAGAAAAILAGVADERLLILTHPDMQTFIERKAGDPDRWAKGMRRLWARGQNL
jgi:NAD(P)-dependent dehydrogenase (short-subunit alcohol dehydrogenase family)